ncbi:MAG: M48 family metalloprotease [Deltaproteobacteria bacterium]|nr:M48 family metalloprotease [Deltaproteobacteria bacterium]
MSSPPDQPTPTQTSLLSALIKPALLIFAVPAFAWWFGGHVAADYDQQLQEGALAGIEREVGLADAEREALRVFYTTLRPSVICAGDDPAEAALRENLASVCPEYTQHRWIQRAGLISIGLGLLTALIGGVAVAAAMRSRAAQLPAFRVAWGSLRLISAAQVVIQGALCVALSFWVTAYFFELYVVKLIILVAIFALWAVGAVLMGIFAKVDITQTVEGALVTEADAPEFWARLRALSAKIGTEPPVRVIGGIDDNFFVTENPVVLNGERLEGRTLFMSLSLLRRLDAAEAEAVMSHELAHFSGGDTTHSRSLTPMRAKYAQYLNILEGNPLCIPVFFTMLAFWRGFELALAQTSRARELRADRIAAENTRPDAIARALLKVAAWSSYRVEVEEALFSQSQVLSSVNIADRVRGGFAEFVGSERLLSLPIRRTPHPMDSHPPNAERFAALGVELPESVWPEVLLAPTDDSWHGRIPVAEAIEAVLWAAYEARFAAGQRLKVAIELTPRSPEEIALVEEYFPRLVFVDKDGADAVVLTWDRVEHDGWFMRHEDITNAMLDDGVLGKQLVLTGAGGKQKINLRTLPEQEQLVQLLGRYLGRARRAKEVRELSS